MSLNDLNRVMIKLHPPFLTIKIISKDIYTLITKSNNQ